MLRSAEFLVEFLKETDATQFRAKQHTAKHNKGPERLDELNTLYGGIDIGFTKRAKHFCYKLNNYITTYEDINK